jgi:hypothetical protein
MTNDYDATGACCKVDSSEGVPQCQESIEDNISCTYTPDKMPLPIYMSYWPTVGQTECTVANRVLEATASEQEIVSSQVALGLRSSTYFESCYYEIKPAASTFRDGSYI